MIIEQTNHFKRLLKKANKSLKKPLDDAIKEIITNPEIGASKVGDLTGVRVFKYKVKSSQYLLAYAYCEELEKITLLSVGVHENFYRDLKRQR